jgi:hypothetical protein
MEETKINLVTPMETSSMSSSPIRTERNAKFVLTMRSTYMFSLPTFTEVTNINLVALMGSSTISSSSSLVEENNNELLPIGISTVFITNLCGGNQHQTGGPLESYPMSFSPILTEENISLFFPMRSSPGAFLTDMYRKNQPQRNHNHGNVHSAFIADDYGRSQYKRFRIYALFHVRP